MEPRKYVWKQYSPLSDPNCSLIAEKSLEKHASCEQYRIINKNDKYMHYIHAAIARDQHLHVMIKGWMDGQMDGCT